MSAVVAVVIWNSGDYHTSLVVYDKATGACFRSDFDPSIAPAGTGLRACPSPLEECVRYHWIGNYDMSAVHEAILSWTRGHDREASNCRHYVERVAWVLGGRKALTNAQRVTLFDDERRQPSVVPAIVLAAIAIGGVFVARAVWKRSSVY